MKCPLCSRQLAGDSWSSYVSDDLIEMEDQIIALGNAQENLMEHPVAILEYLDNRELLCPLCHDLTEDIDEEDYGELVQRIDSQLEKLVAKARTDVIFDEPVVNGASPVFIEEKEPELMEFGEDTDMERDENYQDDSA